MGSGLDLFSEIVSTESAAMMNYIAVYVTVPEKEALDCLLFQLLFFGAGIFCL